MTSTVTAKPTCSTVGAEAKSEYALMTSLRITTKSGSTAETAAAADLARSIERLPIAPWLFTHHAVIAENAIPHSHPTLTLTTRNGGNFQVSSLIHEQLHWHCVNQHEKVTKVIGSILKRRYPDVPVGRPDGAATEESTYLHLVVCVLEWDALQHLIGNEQAQRVINGFVAAGLYAWVYRTVTNDHDQLMECLRAHGLDPRAAPPMNELDRT